MPDLTFNTEIHYDTEPISVTSILFEWKTVFDEVNNMDLVMSSGERLINLLMTTMMR